MNAESTTALSKRFTSYERSERTGLDYAVNRTYNPGQGRFTQVDPIGMSASSLGSPQTLNLYSYCGNDPINHTDPDGLFWGFVKKLFKWVLLAVAVLVAVTTIVGVIAAFMKNVLMYFFPVYTVFIVFVFNLLFISDTSNPSIAFPIGLSILFLASAVISHFSTSILLENLFTPNDGEKYKYYGLFSSLIFARQAFLFGIPLISILYLFLTISL